MSPRAPSEAELSDFIDGRLDDQRRGEIERWLADHPARAREVERQRQLNDALKQLGAEILDEPVPERLRDVLRRASSDNGSAAGSEGGRDGGAPQGRGGRPFGNKIGAAALVLLGLGIGWIGRSALEPEVSALDTLLADASYAHTFYSRDRDHAIEFLPDQIADFAAASSAMFEREISPPDLQEAGFEFLGARIAPVGHRTSTFFFFGGRDSGNVTVLFWPRGVEDVDPPGVRTFGEIATRFWFWEGLGFAVLSAGDARTLDEISDRVVSFYGPAADG